MIQLGVGQTLSGKADTDLVINYNIEPLTMPTATADSFAPIHGQLPSSTGTLLTSTNAQTNIKSLTFFNTIASAVVVTIYKIGTGSSDILKVLTLPANGGGGYEDGLGFYVAGSDGVVQTTSASSVTADNYASRYFARQTFR